MYNFIIYYKCKCGKEFTKVEEVLKEKAKCWCNDFADTIGHEEVGRYSHKPHGRIYDLPGYESPVSGKWVEGRVARRNDLAASGCVEYDPGMKEDQEKKFKKEDAILESKIDEHVEKTIYEMPTEKREKLATELEHFDVDVTRA